jgi:hypothetical protein
LNHPEKKAPCFNQNSRLGKRENIEGFAFTILSSCV